MSAPHGTITLADGLNGTSTDNLAAVTDSLAFTGNETAINNTISSLMTDMGTITSDEKGDDENELKKKTKEGGKQTTDDKKTDDGKKYCN